MKKIIINIAVLIVGMHLFSCKEASYLLYEDEARIQFGPEQRLFYSQSSIHQDSLKSFTFAYVDQAKMVDTVYFDIYTMGDVSTRDRSFKLVQEQIAGSINAKPDVHYKRFDDPALSNAYVIKAGTTHSRLPIVLLRDQSLTEGSVVLKFSVVNNEHFIQGQENLTWRKLIFTDMLSKPTAWNTGFLGKYSVVKHRFLISATDQKWDDEFIRVLVSDVQAQHYWMEKVKKQLINYNKEHLQNPLLDEDKELVIFP